MLLRLYSALWPLLTPLIKRYLKKTRPPGAGLS